MYSADHHNYLCMNYTRPTPLPCKPVIDQWKARWWNRSSPSLRPKFVIYSWWPPNPADIDAYAHAGFNMAITSNMLGAYCQAKGRGKVVPVSYDELFEANVRSSDALAKLGILAVFDTDNDCNQQVRLSSPPYAYGNATGGVIGLRSNLTARAPASLQWNLPWAGMTTPGLPYSKGLTIPELKYITGELTRRGKLEQFAGIQMHDDTLLQTGEDIGSTQWLKEHVPAFVPFVNQVAPGPQTLARTGLPTYMPEQYPIQCPNSNCSDPKVNATAMAIAQMSGYAANAWVDARFGLHSWPLFNIGAGNNPLHNASLPPDHGLTHTRSDSLVRWMTYAAVAYGAKALNYYCWGGGVYWTELDLSKPGMPSPSYQTVVEVNADVGTWGDELVGNGFRFSGALHTGFRLQDGSNTPSSDAIVVSMSDDLLVGVFVPPAEDGEGEGDGDGSGTASSAYLFVVDKRVSGQLAPVAARNITLTLHPSVGAASVAPPGRQGPRGFDELRAKHGVKPPPPRGPRRAHYAHVEGDTHGGNGNVVVTVELVGGGGGFVRLTPKAGMEDALLDACFNFVTWIYRPSDASMSAESTNMNFGLKQASWEYDSFPASYRPYEGLELTSGRSFETGEQTSFVIGVSFAGASPPTAMDEIKAWAYAGYNLLSLEAPSPSDLAAFGNASEAVSTVLDAAYTYGYFAVLEPPSSTATTSSSSVFTPARVVALTRTFRCHARFGGLVLAQNMSNPTQVAAAVSATSALRTYAQGNWLLPFASASSASNALTAAERGVVFPMPMVAPFAAPGGGGGGGAAAAIAWAQAVVAQYEPLRAKLAAAYRLDTTSGQWRSDASFAFVASVDACASESDSLLRWSAFSALAYGARGLFWRGAAKCAPYGSPKFGLLASINRRVAQWGNTFVSSWRNSDFPGGGYNVTQLWSSGFTVPHASKPGSGGPSDLVQPGTDKDVLIARLGSLGRHPSTALIYVVDMRVDPKPGGAPPRELKVELRSDVLATQPIEGDCAASRCQCGMSLLGSTLKITLPGGSGQLVALSLESDIHGDIP